MVDLKQEDRDKIGFEIGYDIAMYRLTISDDSPKSVADGYRAKKDRGGSTKRSDKFIRKWLNLRLHALQRNITYSEDLTPEYLEAMLNQHKGRCPITNAVLTFGTLSSTDWSVDRLLNEYGYTKGNVEVMSTMANHAKSDLSLEEIWKIVKTGREQYGLTHKQWQKIRDYCEEAKGKLSPSNLGTIQILNNSEKEYKINLLLSLITDPDIGPDQCYIDQLAAGVIMTAPKSKQKILARHLRRIRRKRENNSNQITFMKKTWGSPNDRRAINELQELPKWDVALNAMENIQSEITNISMKFAASQRA